MNGTYHICEPAGHCTCDLINLELDITCEVHGRTTPFICKICGVLNPDYISYVDVWKTYDEWKRFGMQVQRFQQSLVLDLYGNRLFHVTQTDRIASKRSRVFIGNDDADEAHDNAYFLDDQF